MPGCVKRKHQKIALYCDCCMALQSTPEKPDVSTFLPSPELRPFVRHYYLFAATNPGISQITAAWTRQLLVLQYGNRLKSSLGGEIRPVQDAAVSGSVTLPYVFQPEDPRFQFFVIEFSDIGLYCLFRENSTHFVDTTMDVMDVVPARKRQAISDALYEVEDLHRKVSLIEQFLRDLLPGPEVMSRIRNVTGAVSLIRAAGGWVPIQEVADDLDVSERHLRRQFRDVTGLAPKVFARILRFSGAAATLLDTRDATELFSRTSRAFLSDYTDQSHFNHEFKEFTGYAPGALPFERFQTFSQYTHVDELLQERR
jgi:AraC-like DNA-binding protein